jgi:hypothetical protein
MKEGENFYKPDLETQEILLDIEYLQTLRDGLQALDQDLSEQQRQQLLDLYQRYAEKQSALFEQSFLHDQEISQPELDATIDTIMAADLYTLEQHDRKFIQELHGLLSNKESEGAQIHQEFLTMQKKQNTAFNQMKKDLGLE